MNYWLLLFPFISAFIGWFAARMAIQWWFRSGKMPAFQQELAENLGKLAGGELISFDEIEAKITDPGTLSKLMPEVEEHIDHFLRVKLKEVMPVIGMLIGERTILQLKTVFMEELRVLFPVFMKSYTRQLKEEIDLEKIIRHKLETFPPAKLKSMLYTILSGEIRLLQAFGGLLGLLIGLIHLFVTLFLYK